MPLLDEPPATRAPSRLRRVWWTGYGVLLAAILVHAANLRFSLPQTPLSDPDVWGYLNPALSKLTGGPFQHTFGRNFVYPTFLYAILRTFGDYRLICVLQHTLGLLTGVLLAGAWNTLCGFLSGPAWSRWAACFLGLALVADFLFSRWPIIFEQQIRPESIFPFLLAFSFLLNFVALRAGYVARRPRLEGWCLGMNVFVTVAAQSLKPSMGLGLAAANLPFAVYLLRPGTPWQKKTLVAGLAVTVTALTLWLPERVLAKGDNIAALFLPTTLFTIHARYIDRQIKDDLRAGDTAPYNPEWLAGFDRQLENTLAKAAQPDQSAYRTLGFNPDYLMYVEPVFYPAFRSQEQPEIIRFCHHYYRRAWLRQPGAMLSKVGKQLAEVYAPHIKPGAKHRLRKWFYPPQSAPPKSFGPDYRLAWTCWQDTSRQATLFKTRDGGAYLERLKNLADTSAVIGDPPWVQAVNALVARWHLPLLGLTLTFGLALLARSWRGHGPLVAGVWLVWTTNFLMFLTVAIAHSLEPLRYVENQRVCTALGAFLTLLLSWQGLTLLGDKYFRKLAVPGRWQSHRS